MNLLKIKIVTNRLLLKPIAMQYKSEIFKEFINEIAIYMTPRPAIDIFETESFINESITGLTEGSNLQLVIIKKDTQEFLGCTGIHNLKAKAPSLHPEFGIWLKKSAHGNCYGLETIHALKEWAEENLDFDYLIYPVDRNNYPSRRIPERLGGIIVKQYDKQSLSGNTLHLLEYKIPKSSC
ncbi:GNAT family N-acetyltransferase [Calothrix sp. HK-06]|nr:GNAT family N-acetyltransferase [Calothrix sp. HK-06]